MTPNQATAFYHSAMDFPRLRLPRWGAPFGPPTAMHDKNRKTRRHAR